MTTNVQAIHVYTLGDYLYVSIEVDGRWVCVMKEHAPMRETTVSHIVEPNAAPVERTTP